VRCLELARADRDPQWPVVAAQLAATRRGNGVDGVLATLAAALGATEALGWLDSGGEETPVTVGGVVEFTAGGTRRRTVRPHPSCGCVETALLRR
jgi:hypothetical protein